MVLCVHLCLVFPRGTWKNQTPKTKSRWLRRCYRRNQRENNAIRRACSSPNVPLNSDYTGATMPNDISIRGHVTVVLVMNMRRFVEPADQKRFETLRGAKTLLDTLRTVWP